MPISSPYPVTRHETVPPGEERAVAEVLRMVMERLRGQYPAGTTARRDAHPKHHGVVRATLEVEPALPEEYRFGVFAAQQSYPAWVRFSNGSGEVQADHLPDGRGVGLKLMNVAGTKLLDDEADAMTQDFLFINHDVFFVKDAKDYVEFFRISMRDKVPTKFFLSLNPFKWRLKEFMNVKKIRVQIADPLNTQYWSMVPLLMGDRPAKVSLRPSLSRAAVMPARPGPDYLREVMAAQLAAGEVCFDLLVQLQADDRSMPVEDPRIRWAETESPFRKVAMLRIPLQRFDSPAQMAFAEQLSYTPWHCVSAHRPLGGVNRCRFSVYREISRFRHAANDVPRREPTGDERF